MSKRKILIGIGGLFLFFIFLFAGFIRQQYVVPILMYHSVSPTAQPENRLAVTPEAFERQMRFLKNHAYNVLPLEEIAGLVREKKEIPLKTLAITFDDGYKDNFLYAFPVLKKYNLPATVFIIVNEVGRPEKDRLSWDEIDEMRNSGIINIGSHCLGPEPLLNIKSDEALKKEIFESKKALQEKLGQPVDAFSYPGGGFNEEIKKLVIDAGYLLAVTTSPGSRFACDDVFALKRLRISSTSNNLFVFWVETSGFYTFLKERRDSD